MKFLISVTILVAVCFGLWQLSEVWDESRRDHMAADKAAAVAAAQAQAQMTGDQLDGLPSRLYVAYNSAQQRGAQGLRDFLAAHSKELADPRLAWIQLDYVLLETSTDLADARRVFAEVKKRVPPGSPVYNRVKQMEASYQ